MFLVSICCNSVSDAAYVMLDISKTLFPPYICWVYFFPTFCEEKWVEGKFRSSLLTPLSSEPVRLVPTANQLLPVKFVERSLPTQAVCTDTGRFTVATSLTSAPTAHGESSPPAAVLRAAAPLLPKSWQNNKKRFLPPTLSGNMSHQPSKPPPLNPTFKLSSNISFPGGLSSGTI